MIRPVTTAHERASVAPLSNRAVPRVPGFDLQIALRDDAPLELADRNDATVVHQTPRGQLRVCAPTTYPWRSFEDERFLYYFEGFAYGVDPARLREELRRVAEASFNGASNSSTVSRWVESTDGDFVVVIAERSTDRWRVINDWFGRLPVYIHRNEGRITASRHLGVARDAATRVELDPIGSGLFLLLGYTVGDRTPWGGVERLGPGTEWCIDPHEGRETTRSVFSIDFTERDTSRTRAENAQHLAELFRAATLERVQTDRPTVVSLSGGLDSRAVAAALTRVGESFDAMTMVRPGWYPESETFFARLTAERLGQRFHEFRVEEPKADDYLSLLDIKSGGNEIGMAFLLQFLREMRSTFGASAVQFTGDGGDKAMPDLRPVQRLECTDDVVRCVIQRRGLFPLRAAAKIAGVDEGNLLDSLRAQIDSYPESSAEGRFIRFMVFERGANCLLHGEDRNRAFLWSVTPFYGLEFFRAAMKCPPEQKAGSELYRQFIHALSPALDSMGVPGLWGDVGSTRYRWSSRVKAAIKSRREWSRPIAKWVKGKRGFQPDAPPVELMRSALAREPVRQVLEASAIESVLDDSPRFEKLQMFHLLTLILSVERALTGESALSEWSGRTLR